jgi:PIN domain nuclease of toxin-antitoxin system
MPTRGSLIKNMILLDTHTWIWTHSATKLLSDNVKKLIKKTLTDQRAIASISIWEFAMMVVKGRINVKIDPKLWLDNAIKNSGLKVIKLSPEIALESCNLPGDFHKDPADQIIVATARIHNLTLLTKDRKILSYRHVNALW